MARPKGLPKTGGRQKGQPNKKNAETIERAKEAGLLPHEFLLAVCQGQEIDGHIPTFEERMDAAGKAAPYYAPKLASVEQKHSGSIEAVTKEQRDAAVQAALRADT